MAKISAKSVIEAGIRGSKTVAAILKDVMKKCPDSKADASHVRFYANKLIRDGELAKEVGDEKYGCGSRGRKKNTPATVKQENNSPTKGTKVTESKSSAKAKVKNTKAASDTATPRKSRAKKADAVKEPAAKKVRKPRKSSSKAS